MTPPTRLLKAAKTLLDHVETDSAHEFCFYGSTHPSSTGVELRAAILEAEKEPEVERGVMVRVESATGTTDYWFTPKGTDGTKNVYSPAKKNGYVGIEVLFDSLPFPPPKPKEPTNAELARWMDSMAGVAGSRNDLVWDDDKAILIAKRLREAADRLEGK